MNGLKPTCDRKTKFWPNQFNTFGLLPGRGPGGTCPGSTTAPGGCWYLAPGRKLHACYVDNVMCAYRGVRAILTHNTELLRSCRTASKMASCLSAEFERFRAAELRHAKRTNAEPVLRYRLHWSGDVFNKPYAEAIRIAVEQCSDIEFWMYTRSFFAVPILANIDNMVLYLSLDPVNVREGLETFARHSKAVNLQVCYMNRTNDFGDIAKEFGLCEKLRTCPVDAGAIPLDGGCAKCGRCYKKPPKAVWFST